MAYTIKTKKVSVEQSDYIRKNFYYDNGNVYRTDKKKQTTGSLDKNGYLIIKIKGVHYKAHQVVWFLKNGEWAGVELDHINGNKLDNRIENLRKADRQTQCINTKLNPNPKTGVVGIYRDDITRGLKAKFTFRFKGKTYRYRTLQDAVVAKNKMREEVKE